jgi:hypothetical protein
MNLLSALFEECFQDSDIVTRILRFSQMTAVREVTVTNHHKSELFESHGFLRTLHASHTDYNYTGMLVLHYYLDIFWPSHSHVPLAQCTDTDKALLFLQRTTST